MLTSAMVAIALFALLLPTVPPSRAMLISFNVGAGMFLILMLVLMFRASVESMHRRARIQEEGKWIVLILSLCVAAVVLLALYP